MIKPSMIRENTKLAKVLELFSNPNLHIFPITNISIMSATKSYYYANFVYQLRLLGYDIQTKYYAHNVCSYYMRCNNCKKTDVPFIEGLCKECYEEYKG